MESAMIHQKITGSIEGVGILIEGVGILMEKKIALPAPKVLC